MNLASLISSNQFLSGGLVLGAAAAALAWSRRGLGSALAALRARVVAEVQVWDYETVTWLGVWLASTPYGRRCRRVKTFTWGGTVTETSEAYPDGPQVFFEPGYGVHILRHGGRWLWVERHKENEGAGAQVVGAYPRDYFVVRALGPRSAVEAVVEEAKLEAREALSRRYAAYLSDGHGGWDRLSAGVPRPASSVVLDGDLAERLVGEARAFLNSRAWYVERGVPWRFTAMLYGPPGTGKTSIARALAFELRAPLYVLDLTDKECDDRALILTLSRVPSGAVVLLEDVDIQLEAKKTRVTLSGLLNALDGPLAPEGRVVIVTTNHPERLAAAVGRPGRVNRRYLLGLASRDQARRLFLRFHPGREEEAEVFSSRLTEGAVAPAAIQQHLLDRAGDPRRAALEAHLLERPEPRAVDDAEAAGEAA